MQGGKGFMITSGAGNEGVGSCYALNAFATTKDKEIEIAYQYDEASQLGEPLAVDRIVKKTFKGQKP
jgi:hypothetical protein